MTVNKANGRVRVEFMETHVGHVCDIKFLFLAKESRDEIKKKLLQNVPIKSIVNDIKNNVPVTERTHLITAKDVSNIEIQLRNDQKKDPANAITVVDFTFPEQC